MDPIVDLARERVCAGRLPRVAPLRTYGGPATGRVCSVCDQTITTPDLERDAVFPEVDGVPAPLFFHFPCFHAYTLAIR